MDRDFMCQLLSLIVSLSISYVELFPTLCVLCNVRVA